jgi:hypothetical protein
MNGVAEEGGKLAGGIVESLKAQPLALALVMVNLLFLVAGGFALHELGGSMLRKDELLAKLAENCMVQAPKADEGKRGE